MVENDDDNHAGLDFTASKERRGNENNDRDRNSGDGESKLGVTSIRDNDDKLDNETEEEEEVELEKSDIDLVLLASSDPKAVHYWRQYLIVEEALLHAIISTDVLQNVPSEFLVQLPGNEAHADGHDADDGRDSNEIRSHVNPHSFSSVPSFERIVQGKHVESNVDLVDLNRGINDESKVRKANANNLDSVCHAKSVPHHHELV